MDTVLSGGVFAFTAIDIFTRESDVLLRSSLEAVDGKVLLDHCMPRRFDNFAETIQTDGVSEFKDAFSESALDYCNRHRVARPYKKNEQSYIESFNRSLRKECLGWSKYKATEIPQLTLLVEKWLRYYHYVPLVCNFFSSIIFLRDLTGVMLCDRRSVFVPGQFSLIDLRSEIDILYLMICHISS